MSIFKAMDISSSGLAAQRLRMNILSSNLANAQTTRTPEGGPYKRRDVVFTAQPLQGAFQDLLSGGHDGKLTEVKVTGIHEDPNPPRRVLDPTHQDADADGYVEMPNVNIMTEMVNMIAATRAYEANATALNDAKQMALKSLEIGR